MWSTAADGQELLKRIGALPGFGAQKAQDLNRLTVVEYTYTRIWCATRGRCR